MKLLREFGRAFADIGIAILLLLSICALGTAASLGAVLMGEALSR